MLSVGRLGTTDIERAKAFYDPLAALLGASRVVDTAEVAGYQGAQGVMFLIGKPYEGNMTVGNGSQLSFAAPSRAAVDEAYAQARHAGSKCEGPPGERGGGFYAAYFRDLDGNKLMVFYRAS